MRFLSAFSLCLMVGCGSADSGAPEPVDAAASDAGQADAMPQPESGSYFVVFHTTQDDCDTVTGPDGTRTLEITVDANKVHVVGEGVLDPPSADYYCPRIGPSGFDCNDQNVVLDLRSGPYDVVITRVWDHAGSWTDPRRFESIVSFTETCEGTECAEYSAAMFNVPCIIMTEFVGNLP